MRILFINANAFLPQLVGGVEVNTLSLSAALRERGHEVFVLCGLMPKGWLWVKYLLENIFLRRKFSCSNVDGLKVYRARYLDRVVRDVSNELRPDAVVIQGGKPIMYQLAKKYADLGPPVFIYVHDVLSISSIDEELLSKRIHWISNSEFTRRKLQEALKLESSVVPPIFSDDEFRTVGGDSVTLVNPLNSKGGQFGLALARECPEIRFLFVMSDKFISNEILSLVERTKQLENVSWMSPQKDMRRVYSRTRLLIVPSQVPESWGRVVTEAHQSGIPVIARAIGALPETVGPGGILMERDAAPAEWSRVIKQLLSNHTEYDRLSKAASEWSGRNEVKSECVVDAFLRTIQSGSLKKVEYGAAAR